MDGKIENDHPTVKPVDLIEWMVKLVTREGQTVLDLFGGSGTTACACIDSGRSCVIIEKETEYYDILRERVLLKRKLSDRDVDVSF
jgi:site-specific DNA-methyltransferase (adenine-specific)